MTTVYGFETLNFGISHSFSLQFRGFTFHSVSFKMIL